MSIILLHDRTGPTILNWWALVIHDGLFWRWSVFRLNFRDGFHLGFPIFVRFLKLLLHWSRFFASLYNHVMLIAHLAIFCQINDFFSVAKFDSVALLQSILREAIIILWSKGIFLGINQVGVPSNWSWDWCQCILVDDSGCTVIVHCSSPRCYCCQLCWFLGNPLVRNFAIFYQPLICLVGN